MLKTDFAVKGRLAAAHPGQKNTPTGGVGEIVSEFTAVTTRADLDALDSDEMIAGYRAGREGAAEPGSAFSRSYWHGWRNGAVDGRHRQINEEQQLLARIVVARQMRMQ